MGLTPPDLRPLTLSHLDQTEGIEPPAITASQAGIAANDRAAAIVTQRPTPEMSAEQPAPGEPEVPHHPAESLPPQAAPRRKSNRKPSSLNPRRADASTKANRPSSKGEGLDVPTFLTKGAKAGVRDERLQSKCAPQTSQRDSRTNHPTISWLRFR